MFPTRGTWLRVFVITVIVAFAAACGGARKFVNNPATDLLGAATTQSETSISKSGNVIVIGFNDSGGWPTSQSFTGYGYSVDGGINFADAGVLAPSSGGSNSGDPSLGVDNAGNFYFATLASDSQAKSVIGIARSTSTSADVTFSGPVLVPGLDPDGFQDKELIAVDTTSSPHSGNVYLVWTEFPTTGGTRILFSRSVDAGASYSTPVQISSASSGVSGAMPAIGPNGELYVAWEDRSSSTIGRIKLRVSTDGGVSFSAEVEVAQFTRIRDTSATSACGRPALNGNIRVNEFPGIAVDGSGGGSDGNVYIVFAADPDGNQSAGDDSDIFFTSSTDGGSSWSVPIAVNKGSAVVTGTDATLNDNFFPFVAVTPNGTIDVLFYDRRHDASNRALDVYHAVSRDGGSQWSNERLTENSFGVPPLLPNFDPYVRDCYLGDYNYAVSDASGLYMTWGDNSRSLNGSPNPNVKFHAITPPP